MDVRLWCVLRVAQVAAPGIRSLFLQRSPTGCVYLIVGDLETLKTRWPRPSLYCGTTEKKMVETKHKASGCNTVEVFKLKDTEGLILCVAVLAKSSIT
jgi:hypothetical protein